VRRELLQAVSIAVAVGVRVLGIGTPVALLTVSEAVTLSPTDSPRSPPQGAGVQSESEVHEFPSFGPPWHFRSLIASSMSLALTMPTSAT
jgi:hypothetical protein